MLLQFDAGDLNDYDISLLANEDSLDLDFDWNDLEAINSVSSVLDTPIASTWTDPKITHSLDTLNVPPEIRFMLAYYTSEVAPRLCVDTSSNRNPYNQYILPLAIEVPSLLYACVALAACQLDIRLGGNDYRLKSLTFKGKTIERLQETLYSEERAKDQGTLATILMLSLCDISLGGFARFDTHFLGARKLIDMRQSQHTPGNFVEQYLAWLDTMSATSHHRKPVFSTIDITNWTKSSSDEARGWSYDVFSCPIDHFEIVHEIVDLYMSQADPSCPHPVILEKVAYYKNLLLTRPMQLERGESWLHLTEAYRFAIVLYLVCLFHCAKGMDEIAWLVSSVFFHAQSTQASTGWADQLLWPLFHAALEITDDERKDWLRNRAASMQLSGGFRNVESAMKVLEGVWTGTSPRNYMELVTGDEAGSMMFV